MNILWFVACAYPSGFGQIVLDYRIDRPRVLAIRTDPPLVVGGAPVTIEALVLAPWGTPITGLRASTCALDPYAVTTWYYDLSCFSEEELVVPLGDLPVVWEVPEQESCPDTGYAGYYGYSGYEYGYGYTGCASTLPILVTAESAAGPAYGSLFVQNFPLGYGELDWDGDGDVEPPPAIAAAEQALTWTGDLRAGGEVELSYQIRTLVSPDSPGFSWYVDDGVLLGTGRTTIWEYGEWTRTGNTLRIPEDWHGPLRVVVVAADGTHGQGGDVAWSVLVLEVP